MKLTVAVFFSSSSIASMVNIPDATPVSSGFTADWTQAKVLLALIVNEPPPTDCSMNTALELALNLLAPGILALMTSANFSVKSLVETTPLEISTLMFPSCASPLGVLTNSKLKVCPV